MHHFVACANTKSLRRNCAPPHWGEWLAQRVGSGMGCGGYVQGNSTCLMISHTSQAGGHSGVCGVLCLIFFVRYWKHDCAQESRHTMRVDVI